MASKCLGRGVGGKVEKIVGGRRGTELEYVWSVLLGWFVVIMLERTSSFHNASCCCCQVGVATGHTNNVTAVRFSRTSKKHFIVSVSNDTTLKLWSLADVKPGSEWCVFGFFFVLFLFQGIKRGRGEICSMTFCGKLANVNVYCYLLQAMYLYPWHSFSPGIACSVTPEIEASWTFPSSSSSLLRFGRGGGGRSRI